MMASAVINLQVSSPEETLEDCMVSLVELPGVCGRFEVLAGHAPLITSLVEGDIRYIGGEGDEHKIAVKSGFVEVRDNKVLVCVEVK